MTIWAFKDPTGYPLYAKYVQESLDRGQSRFGWGYVRTANLRVLEPKPIKEMTEDERDCWKKAGFLLGIQRGDWVVHVNTPSHGWCTAAVVTGDYFFDFDSKVKDFGHGFTIDPATKIVFDRNDASVHPRVSRSLKPRKRYQRVYYVEEFLASIAKLENGGTKLGQGDTVGKIFLREEIRKPLRDIAGLIHRNHPSKSLEYFVCEIFNKLPGVTKATVNGSGFGTDYGADVLVRYQTGLHVADLDLTKEETVVVQVKSYDFKKIGRAHV